MVSITLRILSRPDVEHLPKIYQNLGLDYDERVLPSIANEILKAIVAQHNAAELIEERELVRHFPSPPLPFLPASRHPSPPRRPVLLSASSPHSSSPALDPHSLILPPPLLSSPARLLPSASSSSSAAACLASQVSARIRQELLKRAREFNIRLEDVSIVNLTFGQEFTRAVEQKQIAQQDAERAKYIVEMVRFSPDRTDRAMASGWGWLSSVDLSPPPPPPIIAA